MIQVLTNAKIFTSDRKNLWADTVVIEDGKFVFVGNSSEAEYDRYVTSNAMVYDLNGKTVVPGIVDSHVHPSTMSKSSWHIKTPIIYNVDEMLTFIKEYAEAHTREEVPILYFEYYPSVMFDEKGPRKELLDSVVSDRPCLVQDFGEHMCWVNTAFLEALEVDKHTPDPEPGYRVFVRDEDGTPTGFIKELAWLDFEDNLYKNVGWRPPTEVTYELFEPINEFMSSHGVVALADAWIEHDGLYDLFAELEKKRKLHFYVQGFQRFYSFEDLPGKLAEAKEMQKKYGSEKIRIDTMKLFLDGTHESGNAYLVEPKINDPSGKDHGEIVMSEDDLVKSLLYCNAHDFDLHIHLVGDGSFRRCCNAMERAKQIARDKWHIEFTLAHCELVHPDDMKRPAELGITINWTPRWAGGCYGEQGIYYLGQERWNSMYQFNPMIESGANVAFSSDVINWGKIERANPFFGMQIGHTRVDIADPINPEKYPGGVRPLENAKLDRETLMLGYTISGAIQMHLDDKLGSIEVGKLANLAVLGEDYFTCEPTDIVNVPWDLVMFEGKTVSGSLEKFKSL